MIAALAHYRDADAPDYIEAFCDQLPFHIRSTYGGDTCCTAIDNGDDEVLIIDAGSGLRSMGNAMMANCTGLQVVHIFLSHLHWDHIQGFPFFIPGYIPRNKINFYCVHDEYEAKLRQEAGLAELPRVHRPDERRYRAS